MSSAAKSYPGKLDISDADILAALQRYWGYQSFRPLQQRIVGSLLAGRDSCVVMPTGGGKSLCYQLPAALLPDKTVIVISPLIALMQDQMAQLDQMGIPAGTLNSAITGEEQLKIVKRAIDGGIRLLYLSPERLARKDTIDWLKRLPISFFAIDEAHCISEWGHEFRPDYRQLSALRQHFPEIPIAAFTASATRQVRHDIIAQLRLRNPDKYIASFHRPNLRYLVKQCEWHEQSDLLLAALRRNSGENAIVYSPTINRVTETVALLMQHGIEAASYHGKMDGVERKRNQERWMSDEVNVMVGTIAFGLGINKPSVRAVVHLALPKSIEQYYQEAGRAGRDGEPADCLLLWQKRDVGLLTYFIDQMKDPAEKERSWQRYHQVLGFVQDAKCRHLQICSHFGETPKWNTCGACDVCSAAPEWLTPAMPARRPSRRSKSPDERRTRFDGAAQTSVAPRGNSTLSEALKEWRRTVARQQGLAAFIVLHDVTIEDLCRLRPTNLIELRQVPRIGERKAELYGDQILQILRLFAGATRPGAHLGWKTSKPAAETLRLIAKGHNLQEIAAIRKITFGSVVELVAQMIAAGQAELRPEWIGQEKLRAIRAVCAKMGSAPLRALKDALPAEITFDEIRLVVADLQARESQS